MLTLTIRSRLTQEVADLAEASRAFSAARDESGEGGSTFPEGIVTENGKPVGFVSYNGKIFAKPGRKWAPGDEPIYNPYEVRAVSDFRPEQAVVVVFNRGAPGECRKDASIVENKDATCSPLTDMWLVRTAEGGEFVISGAAIDPAPEALPNREFFGIQHGDVADCWMNPGGNLQSQIGAIIFETREEAQTFLDSRRLRRGFRQHLSVQPIAVDTIRDLAAKASHYSTLPPLPARDDRKEWADRAEALTALIPLAA